MAVHRHNSPNRINETASVGKVSPPTSWKWKRIVGVGYGGSSIEGDQPALSTLNDQGSNRLRDK